MNRLGKEEDLLFSDRSVWEIYFKMFGFLRLFNGNVLKVLKDGFPIDNLDVFVYSIELIYNFIEKLLVSLGPDYHQWYPETGFETLSVSQYNFGEALKLNPHSIIDYL